MDINLTNSVIECASNSHSNEYDVFRGLLLAHDAEYVNIEITIWKGHTLDYVHLVYTNLSAGKFTTPKINMGKYWAVKIGCKYINNDSGNLITIIKSEFDDTPWNVFKSRLSKWINGSDANVVLLDR